MITIESGSAKIIEMYDEGSIEVIDNGVLFKGKAYEVTCENSMNYGGGIIGKNIKVVLYDYTVEKLEKGYVEKKIIKRALDKIYEENDDMLYMDMDENVNMIYSELEKEGLFGDVDG